MLKKLPQNCPQMLNIFFKGSSEHDYVIRVCYSYLISEIAKQRSMNRWKFAGAFMSPNGILTNSYNHQGITNAVAALLSLITEPWWHAFP